MSAETLPTTAPAPTAPAAGQAAGTAQRVVERAVAAATRPVAPLRPDDVVLRGDVAARAQRIDLVAPAVSTATQGPTVTETGPWAAAAQSAFEAARQEGFAVGHQAGWEVGLTQGLAEAREQTAELAATVAEMLKRLDASLASVADRVAGEVTELALAVAEAVIGRELAVAADPGADAITRCLRMVDLGGAIVAHLSPTDLERLGPIEGLENAEVTLVADANLATGDAVVLVDQTMVDGRLAQAFERVTEVLR